MSGIEPNMVPQSSPAIDEPFCPKCSLRMKLARVEPLPAHGDSEDQISGNAYVYRCECGEEIEKYSMEAR